LTTTFSDWSYVEVRARIIEAALTLRASPATLGPRMLNGSMSGIDDVATAYGYNEITVRRSPPSAEELSRMEETWTWINAFLDEAQRKFVYDYGFIKTRKGKTIEAFLTKIGMSRSSFDRRIQEYCQIIADRLNQECRFRLTVPLDAVTQIELEDGQSTVSSNKCDRNATHWIGVQPQIDPALPRLRVLDPRKIRARRKSKNAKPHKGKRPAA
jgi:hypothetical protein